MTDTAKNTVNSFKVEGMNCSHCAASVRSAVEALDHVTAATVDPSNGNLTVTSGPYHLNPDSVKAAVEAAGYRVGPS